LTKYASIPGLALQRRFSLLFKTPQQPQRRKNDLTPMTCKIGEPAQAFGGKKTEAIEDLE